MLFSIGKLSEIKLKRTDTTLDLSQLAKRAGKEKEEEEDWRAAGSIYRPQPKAVSDSHTLRVTESPSRGYLVSASSLGRRGKHRKRREVLLPLHLGLRAWEDLGSWDA